MMGLVDMVILNAVRARSWKQLFRHHKRKRKGIRPPRLKYARVG